MTDIEKKTYKVTLIRAATVGLALVGCTWQLSGVVKDYSAKVDRLDAFVKSHTAKDSIRDERVAQLQDYRKADRHDIDSLSNVFKPVTLRSRPGYYTQRWINGRLMQIPIIQ